MKEERNNREKEEERKGRKKKSEWEQTTSEWGKRTPAEVGWGEGVAGQLVFD